jgi:ribonucleotide reductase beta subunit family protein with ferritin-like domain
MESAKKSLPERLVAFVIVEGVFFQCAFAVIFWFKKMYPGKLKGVTYSNELIAADEALHTDHGVEVYKLLGQRLTDGAAHAIFQSAMQVEQFFIEEFLEDGVLGLNKRTMVQFLEYMCDYWLVQLGHAKLYGTTNPLEFMDMLSLKTRTNFFERRNREYRRGKSVDASIQANSFRGTSFDF